MEEVFGSELSEGECSAGRMNVILVRDIVGWSASQSRSEMEVNVSF